METTTNSPSGDHTQAAGSPYCSDPSCQSCKELRETQEAIRCGRPIPRRRMAIG
jgi:hypothetical protein